MARTQIKKPYTVKTQVKTLYTVKTAYFTDHHPSHQGWEGKGWYWYLDVKGCDELYGPYDEQSDAVQAALNEAGQTAHDALQTDNQAEDGWSASVRAD